MSSRRVSGSIPCRVPHVGNPSAGQMQLEAVLRRISTPAEAALGLHAIELMRRQRSYHQQHEPFNKTVVWTFLQV